MIRSGPQGQIPWVNFQQAPRLSKVLNFRAQSASAMAVQ